MVFARRAVVVALVVAAVTASINDDSWVEEKIRKIPLSQASEKIRKIPLSQASELIDTTLSRIVPGVKRGSYEEFIQSGQNHLSVQLDAVNPIADLSNDDESLMLAFTVFNPSSQNVTMCIRDTPLEGVMSKLFMIQNPEGKVMAYRGKDVRRTEVPGPEEYRTVVAGQSTSTRVRLSRRYQFEGDGLYYIRVRQPRDGHMRYTDVMRTQTTIFVKGTQQHEEREAQRVKEREENNNMPDLSLNQVGSRFSTSGCSDSQTAQLTQWHEDARLKIDKARTCTTNNFCSSNIDTWFGSQTTQAQFDAGAKAQFETMARITDSTTYKCEMGNADMRRVCGGSTFAYVYPTDRTQQIYMCDFTFNYPDYSEKVQTVTPSSHISSILATPTITHMESPPASDLLKVITLVPFRQLTMLVTLASM
jgi:hypothetical protein